MFGVVDDLSEIHTFSLKRGCPEEIDSPDAPEYNRNQYVFSGSNQATKFRTRNLIFSLSHRCES